MTPGLQLNLVVDQKNKIHPHKFILWVAIGSIIMMFAGLTSAYIVKREQPGWTTYTTPIAFYYSSAIMLISSLTIFLAGKSFRERRMVRDKKLVLATTILGMVFILLQWLGFRHLWVSGTTSAPPFLTYWNCMCHEIVLNRFTNLSNKKHTLLYD